MSENIDDRVLKTYEYIKKHYNIYGCPPTIREIMANVGIKSTSTVSSHLKKLEELKMISYAGKKSRGIELTELQNFSCDKLVEMKVLGDTAAGDPRLAIEDPDGDSYVFSRDLFSTSGDTFLLNVIGTSMINAGILDGDILVVRKQETASNGNIVVALLDEECVTVKRFYKKDRHVILHPENEGMSDIKCDHVRIIGLVVGLIRTKIR